MANDLPTLLPTQALDETYGGVTYHLEGELVPVLTVDVSRMPVFFEHHILLWKHPTVRVALRPMKGALKRMMAGMQIFVTEASGNGHIAFSRNGAGHIAPLFALPRHRLIDVRQVGASHLRADLASESGGRIQGIAFRVADTPLGDFLMRSRGATVHVAGSLSGNYWNGVRRVQFRIVDAAPA